METQTPRGTSSRQASPSSANVIVDLTAINSGGAGLPNRYCIHAVEGWGKTSLGAKFPLPIFIQARGETGLQTLIDANQLPRTPHFPESMDWETILATVNALIVGTHQYKTLVIDTLNGVERLCHEYVCHRDFSDEWGDKGFASYQKGPEVSLPEWRLLLIALDKLRVTKGMTIVLLVHTRVQKFSNPEGPDYDRYQPDLDRRTWMLTAKWTDVILFGNFESAVTAVKTNNKTNEQKGKGVGGQMRVLYTTRHAAYDAKNRLGLPPEIMAGNSPDECWDNLKDAIVAARVQNKGVDNG